jgi:hypothetical protein
MHTVKANVFFQPSENNTLSLSRRYLPRQTRLVVGVVGRQTDGNTRWLALQSVVCRPDQTTDLVLFDSRFRTRARAIPTGI